MPGEPWGFVEEADISERFRLIRVEHWSPLWRLVAQEGARVRLGLPRCQASVSTINEKARKDYDRLMSCTDKHTALLARIEDPEMVLAHTWGRS